MTTKPELFASICALSEKALAEGVSVDDLIDGIRTQYHNVKEHKAASAKRQARADWDLIIAHLHYNGAQHEALNDADRDSVWVLADGFGVQSLEWIRRECYDWSHVRDSSPEAIARMAARIREVLA